MHENSTSPSTKPADPELRRLTARQQAIDLVVDAWWSAFHGRTRRSPIVIRTRKQDGARLRDMFNFGREAERVCPSPSPEETRPKRRHLVSVV
jgi:hypothetical protein